MFKSLEATFYQTLRDLLRVSPFLLIAMAILWGDAGYNVIFYAIGISLVFAVVSHFIRRTFFPYLDTKVLLDMVTKENQPIAASIAFFGVCYLMATVFQASISLLK